MSKKRSQREGIVYSTDPSFIHSASTEPEPETLPPAQQRLRLRLDTRHRGGKAVTLVEGFQGREADLTELGKRLKNHCGTGGSVKDGQVLIQGDQRTKMLQWLKDNGYSQTK